MWNANFDFVLISSGQLMTFIVKDWDRVGAADILGTTEFTTLELEQAPDVILQKQMTLIYKGKVGRSSMLIPKYSRMFKYLDGSWASG